jgi:hypothetical protein
MPNKKFNRSKTRFSNKKFNRSKRGGSGLTSRLKNGLKRGFYSLKGKLTGQPNITSDSNSFISIDPLGRKVNNIVVKSAEDIYKDLETLITLRISISMSRLNDPQKLNLSKYLSKKPDSSETIFNNLRKIIYSIAISISYLDYTDRNKKTLKNSLNKQIEKLVSSKYVSKATEQINIIIMESDRDQIELEEQLQQYTYQNATTKMPGRNGNWTMVNNVNQSNVNSLMKNITQEQRRNQEGINDLERRLTALRAGGYRKIKKSRKHITHKKRVYA